MLFSVHTYQVTLRESHGCIRGSELEVCLSSLACYISLHHCSFFSYYSAHRYETYLPTSSLCKLLSSDQGEISLATISFRLCPVFIRYIKLCFHAVNCMWNEYGQYYFIHFKTYQSKYIFFILTLCILKIETVCCTDTFGNLILTSQCHCPVDKFHLKQRRENNTSVMFIHFCQFLNTNRQLRN